MPEDFNKLRLISRQLVKTPFQMEWLFRLEIDGEPSDFDFYVKDVTCGPVEVTTEEETYGAVSMTWPTGSPPVRITATVRDNEDGRIAKFADAWIRLAVPGPGIVGLPYGPEGYVRKARIYNQKDSGAETLAGEWEMYATSRGEVSRSRENSAFMEFQISLVQFSTATSIASLTTSQKEDQKEQNNQETKEEE